MFVAKYLLNQCVYTIKYVCKYTYIHLCICVQKCWDVLVKEKKEFSYLTGRFFPLSDYQMKEDKSSDKLYADR